MGNRSILIVCVLCSFCLHGCFNRQSAAPVRPTPFTPPPSAPLPLLDEPAPSSPLPAASDTAGQRVKIMLAPAVSAIQFTTTAASRVSGTSGVQTLPAGEWRGTSKASARPKIQYHVFSKTFKPTESTAATAYATEWRKKGYAAELKTLGTVYQTLDGKKLDNRILWISIARFSTEAEANALVEKLKQEEVWAWTRSERLAPGTGTISFGGAASLSAKLPLRLSSDAPIAISGISQGKGAFAGTILLEVGPTGALEVYEELPFEEYLKGVLPGEMPTSWPVEALAAQAVAARSVSLATSATKHQLDGFWACSEVHCKVYKGRGAHTPASDEAVTKSAGEVLIQDGSIVPAVFCANCGGWSENNEAVWSAPPNAALRGREDSPKGKGVAPRGPVSFGLSKWLTTSPPGYCSADTKNYRWRRTFSNKEATALVNKQYAVGRLRAIEPGERGVSGRLLSLTVVGDKDRVEIRKELPIRQAFGTLPSALFIVESSKGASGPEFTFIGAGNGHGVGLCQHGARGMAQAGASHPEILRHYFASVDLGRIR